MWGSVSGYRNVARSKDKQHTQLHEAYIPVVYVVEWGGDSK